MSKKYNMDDIERSKENILPIRQGRRADVMCSVLSKKDDSAQLEKRSYFENELRSYTGDDPLKIWLEYISWVEQNCITGGKDFNVAELSKKCLFALKDKEKYKNDPRILPIWLKFANGSADPLEIFNYMALNGFCCQLAHFYIEWAWKLEALGSLRSANATLQNGINIGAEPHEALQNAICQLDMRLIKTINAQDLSEAPAAEMEERHAFNKLKPQGKKHLAPVLRVGDNVQERAHLFSSAVENVQLPPKPSGPLEIFQDSEHKKENTRVKEKTKVSSKNMPSYIFNPQVNKENVRDADKWSNVKASKWVPPRSTGTRELGFTFHCDEDQGPEAVNRLEISNVKKNPVSTTTTTILWPLSRVSKKPLIDEFGVLSAKKDVSFCPPVALFEDRDPNRRPMYDKIKVYCGGTEFSFEEIHAAIWYHEEEERQIQERLRSLLLQNATQELEKQCKISQEFCDKGEKKGQLCSENVQDAQVEKLGSDPSSMYESRERNTNNLYHSSHEKVVDDLHAHATSSLCMGGENLAHSQISFPHGMTADILDMMQSLCSASEMNENGHISEYAGEDSSQQSHHKGGTTDTAQSVSSRQSEPVSFDNVGVAQQNLGNQPFQIYCDATEEVPFLHFRSNFENIPGDLTQKVHNIENIPPASYYLENRASQNKRGDLSLAASAAVVGSQSLDVLCEEEDRGDTVPIEPSSFIHGNHTIVPPADTAHFMLDTFMASTPCSKVQSSASSYSKDIQCVTSLCPEGDNEFAIPCVLGAASEKVEVQSKKVTKEASLAFPSHSMSTASVKTFDLNYWAS